VIDVKSEKPSQPAQSQVQSHTSSYTTVVVDSVSVKDTTTNDQSLITKNKYLKLVSEEAVSKYPLLQGQNIVCFSEDVFKSTVQITYIASIKSVNVLVSGFVWVSENRVQIIQAPDS
jgi:hypothetical protein